VAEVVVDDCVELEPHAATHAATRAAAVMNCRDMRLGALVFKILLPFSGLASQRCRPGEGVADGVGVSRIRVADQRVVAHRE
jgi:hypothetical protein